MNGKFQEQSLKIERSVDGKCSCKCVLPVGAAHPILLVAINAGIFGDTRVELTPLTHLMQRLVGQIMICDNTSTKTKYDHDMVYNLLESIRISSGKWSLTLDCGWHRIWGQQKNGHRARVLSKGRIDQDFRLFIPIPIDSISIPDADVSLDLQFSPWESLISEEILIYAPPRVSDLKLYFTPLEPEMELKSSVLAERRVETHLIEVDQARDSHLIEITGTFDWKNAFLDLTQMPEPMNMNVLWPRRLQSTLRNVQPDYWGLVMPHYHLPGGVTDPGIYYFPSRLHEPDESGDLLDDDIQRVFKIELGFAEPTPLWAKVHLTSELSFS